MIHRDYVGEQFILYGSPAHKWYFLDNEEVEDVILFKHTDSRGTDVPCKFLYTCDSYMTLTLEEVCAHAAFENSSVHGTRKSVEVRIICFY